ncbi:MULTISPECIES: hypothetical protein [Legionella]|uniref:Uncharacterized protein n=1 Tax=Legionella drozanskii LLAP-1 TaxID=1212489 RepID=A0A0W0SPS7_9GAMM|nr:MULTISPECIES: hypothetical protein [Legionella]KTC85355.1 hypothetical protein Ldro_2527 [Legionella drozanskii LLAP-1]PJE13985.1 MAG: hypothetical protein CK430_05820 [Legionella sp.]
MPIEQNILDRLAKNDSTLSALDLSNHQINSKDLILLIKALQTNNQLKQLNLASNLIDDEGACLLAQYLRVNHLNLRKNNITDKGIQAFLQNSYLDEISIEGNKYSYLTIKKLDEKVKTNFKNKVNQLVLTICVIAQGRGQSGSPFFNLPPEILFYIINKLDVDLSRASLRKLAKAIFGNNYYDSSGHKVFKWENPKEKVSNYPRFYLPHSAVYQREKREEKIQKMDRIV